MLALKKLQSLQLQEEEDKKEPNFKEVQVTVLQTDQFPNQGEPPSGTPLQFILNSSTLQYMSQSHLRRITSLAVINLRGVPAKWPKPSYNLNVHFLPQNFKLPCRAKQWDAVCSHFSSLPHPPNLFLYGQT